MDKYLRALERSGLDDFDILTMMFNRGDPPHRKMLGWWASFLGDRQERESQYYPPLAQATDEQIIKRIEQICGEYGFETKPSNYALLNEALLRKIEVFASVECCNDMDCSICSGKGRVYTKKRLFPTNNNKRVYHP